MGVSWVDADGVALAGGDQLGLGGAEGGVGAGVAEVPSELHSCDLNLKRGGVGPCVAGHCPEPLGFHGEDGEEKSEGGQREVFDSPEVFWFGGASMQQPYQEEEVRKAQEGKGYPEIEEEMAVQSCAVRASIGGKPPWEREQDRRLMEEGGHSSG